MKKSVVILVLVLVTGMLFTGCREKVDIKLDESYRRVVVEGLLTNETKAHLIKLTLTSDYFSNQAAPLVTGATVTLSDGNSTALLSETAPGFYQTPADYAGVPGKTYTLHISYDGQTYDASSYLRAMGSMDSIQTAIADDRPGFYNVNIFALESPQPDEFYMWYLYKNDSLESDTAREISFADDSWVNGNYIYGMTVYQVKAAPGDSVGIEMYSISKEYYEFMYSLNVESGGFGGPFSGPPANIKGNVSNGALGYFQACMVQRVKTVVH
jgi:hypothetical protein